MNKTIVDWGLNTNIVEGTINSMNGILATSTYGIYPYELEKFFEKVEDSKQEGELAQELSSDNYYKIKETITSGEKSITQEFTDLKDYLEYKKVQKEEDCSNASSNIVTVDAFIKPQKTSNVAKPSGNYIDHAEMLYRTKSPCISRLDYFNFSMLTKIKCTQDYEHGVSDFYNITDDPYILEVFKAYIENYRSVGELYTFSKSC